MRWLPTHSISMLYHDDDAIRYVAASHIGDHQAPVEAENKLRSMLNDKFTGGQGRGSLRAVSPRRS